MLAGLPSKALGEDLSLPLPDSSGCGYITLTSALVCTEPSPLCPLFTLCQTSSAFLLEGPLSLALRFISIPGGTGDKEPICQCRRRRRCGFDPWVGRIPWRRAWQPTPYSCLESSVGRGAWRAIVHRVTKSQTRLKRLHTHRIFQGDSFIPGSLA